MRRVYSYSFLSAMVFSLFFAWWFMSFFSSPVAAQESNDSLYADIQQLPTVNAAPLALDPNKPTLVKLWASWCPLCLSELQMTENWLTDPDLEGANIVTLASPGQLNEKPLAEFQEWYQGLDYKTLPVLLDTEGAVVKALGIRAYPSWAVFSPEGKLVRVVQGSISKAQAQLLITNPEADLKTAARTVARPKRFIWPEVVSGA